MSRVPKEVSVRVEVIKLNRGDDAEAAVEEVPLDTDATEVDLTNLRATSLPDLRPLHQLQRLTFRQNCLTTFDYVTAGCPNLTELDLYENQIEHLEQCKFPNGLVVLDLTHNSIKKLSDLSHLSSLRQLYLVENRLKHITNLKGLSKLKVLELGSNNLRMIEGLEEVEQLEELWLGRNKIDKIQNIQHLNKLKKMSIQSNRLTEIGDGLTHNTELRELYLSHNALSSCLGLSTLTQLTTLDLAGNRLTTLLGVGLESLTRLEELWLNNNLFGEWSQVEPLLSALAATLQTIYLEQNPLQKLQDETEYTNKVRACVPKLQQLDANML